MTMLRRLALGDRLRLNGSTEWQSHIAAVLVLGASIAAVAFAQYVIDNRYETGIPGVAAINDELDRIYGQPQSLVPATFLFLGAGLAFVWAVNQLTKDPQSNDTPPPRGMRLSIEGWRSRVTVCGIAVGAWSYVVWRLYHGSYEGTYPLIFAGAVLVFTLSVGWTEVRSFRPRFSRSNLFEMAFVAALCVFTFWLNVRDLDYWRYSFIGDEGAFFNLAKEFANGLELNAFKQSGVYGYHPAADSIYQGALMRLFGTDYFGWKLSGVLVIVAMITLSYFLMRVAFGSLEASITGIVVASSHYFFAYAHTGYNNIHAPIPIVLGIALFIAGWKNDKTILLLLAGLVSGFAFYTFFPARMTIGIIGVFILLLGPKHWRPALIAPIAVGFVLAVTPIFAVEKVDVINELFRASGPREGSGALARIADNIPRGFFAFHYNTEYKHYIAGPLIDPVAGALAVLGFAYSVSKLKNPTHRLLVVWFFLAVLATGVLHVTSVVAETRMHVVLVIVASFAGIAGARMVHAGAAVASMAGISANRSLLSIGFLLILAPLLYGLNIAQFWGESARESGTTQYTVVVRMMKEDSCSAYADRNVVWGFEYNVSAVNYVFSIYGSGPKPRAVDYAMMNTFSRPTDGCLALLDIDKDAAKRARAAVEAQLAPGSGFRELTDKTGRSPIWVLDPPSTVPGSRQ